MIEPSLESDQARWAQECCKGGTCPVCNEAEDDDTAPQCDVCGEVKEEVRLIHVYGIETYACDACRKE